jgi:hypothetical protein
MQYNGIQQKSPLYPPTIVEMNHHGYALLTSADWSAKYVHHDQAPDYPSNVHNDYPINVHSWFFVPVTALLPPTTSALLLPTKLLKAPSLSFLLESRAPSPFSLATVLPSRSPLYTLAPSAHGSPSVELRSRATATYAI